MTGINLADLVDLDGPNQHCPVGEIKYDYESWGFEITQAEIDEALTRGHLLVDGKKVAFYRFNHTWCVSRDELGDVLGDVAERVEAAAVTNPRVKELLDASCKGVMMRLADVTTHVVSVEGGETSE